MALARYRFCPCALECARAFCGAGPDGAYRATGKDFFMLRVVLVDDEPSVLEGLHLFVNWQELGLEPVGEALDGACALTLIQKERPDLVICDIRMPELDGLELIEKASALNPAPRFLILSGYTDFSYAQKGLRLGALGYLTKPLDRDELARELARAAQTVRAENAARLETLELIRYTANQLYNDVLEGKQSRRLEQKARLLFGLERAKPLRLVQLIAHMRGQAGHGAGDDTLSEALMCFTGITNENCVFYNGDGCYLAVVSGGEAFSADFSQRLRERLYSPGPALQALEAFWVLVSAPIAPGPVLDRLRRGGLELAALQSHCMLHPETVFADYGALTARDAALSRPQMQAEKLLFAELPFLSLSDALGGADRDAVLRQLNRFFDMLARYRVRLELYSVCLYRLADVVTKKAYALGVNAAKATDRFTGAVAAHSPCCYLFAREMCLFVFDRKSASGATPVTALEDEIIGYIKKSFTRGITLQDIAEQFSLSAIIISKIVRKKSGQKFNDYLNYLRIEYAKVLIASQDKKIATVCEEAGYSDYAYFVDKFKTLTGLSPSEYKKRYS